MDEHNNWLIFLNDRVTQTTLDGCYLVMFDNELEFERYVFEGSTVDAAIQADATVIDLDELIEFIAQTGMLREFVQNARKK